MKLELAPLPASPSKLGLDAGLAKEKKRTDVAFYEWIAGKDPNAALAKFMVWMLDELKEEKNNETLRNVLGDWKGACSPEEFKSRLRVLSRLMPDAHPFHDVKGEFGAAK
jgi:hypothetical protein